MTHVFSRRIQSLGSGVVIILQLISPILASMPAFLSAPVAQAQTPSALASLAASMSPGTWAELSTNGNLPALLRDPANVGNILSYQDKGTWNPIANTVIFMGGAHCGSGTCPGTDRFFTYRDSDNTWADLNQTLNTGHTYGHNALNPATGLWYLRMYDSTTVRTWNGTTMGSIAPIPMGSHQVAGAMEVFPDRNSMIFVDGDWGVWEYSFSSTTWTQIANTNANVVAGGTHPMGSYHNFAVYSPVDHVVWFGGGGTNTSYRVMLPICQATAN